jgi:catechol 2,3-dioxygenase-like lactoylglutathione lyase family enzyme
VKINRIAIISVPVADQQVAKAFYTEKLGFTVIRDNPFEDDQRWIELAPPGAATTITLVTWFPHMPPGSIHGLVLDTDNIAEAHETLKTRGLKISPIETAPWGQIALFKDPDGNGWELQQAAFDM